MTSLDFKDKKIEPRQNILSPHLDSFEQLSLNLEFLFYE